MSDRIGKSVNVCAARRLQRLLKRPPGLSGTFSAPLQPRLTAKTPSPTTEPKGNRMVVHGFSDTDSKVAKVAVCLP